MKNRRLAVEMIGKQINIDTENFLERDMQDGILDEIAISYKGTSVSIPLELADINEIFQDFLQNIVEILKEYE